MAVIPDSYITSHSALGGQPAAVSVEGIWGVVCVDACWTRGSQMSGSVIPLYSLPSQLRAEALQVWLGLSAL